MKAWKIVLRGQVVDTVFYDASVTAEMVQRQLISRDGFDPEIEVSPSRIPNWLDDENQEIPGGEEYLPEIESKPLGMFLHLLRSKENQEIDPFDSDSDYVQGCGEENLVELALDQIKKDVAKGDFTAIEELLCFVEPERLRAFVSEY